jgi:hypothetical protein
LENKSVVSEQEEKQILEEMKANFQIDGELVFKESDITKRQMAVYYATLLVRSFCFHSISFLSCFRVE